MRVGKEVLGAAALIAAAGIAPAFAAPPAYTVIDLGSFEGDTGGALPAPRGLNDAGEAVGFSDAIEHDENNQPYRSGAQYLWRNGTLMNLSALLDASSDLDPTVKLRGYNAQGISDAGLVVGDVTDPVAFQHSFFDRVGFIYNPATNTTTAFRADPGVQNRTGATWPTAINGSGIVTGYHGGAVQRLGFVYNPATQAWAMFQALPTEDSAFGAPQNFPNAINDAGWVVGSAQNAEVLHRAFARKPDGTITIIQPTLTWDHSEAKAINGSNTVVGTLYRRGGGWPRFGSAFAWTEQGGAVDLFLSQPELPEDFDGGDAADINDAGQIVGHMVFIEGEYESGTPRYKAIMWDQGTIYDLNSLLSPEDQLRFDITHAVAINDRGEILAFGEHFGYGASCNLPDLPGYCVRSLLLSPVIECAADFDGANGVQVADIFAFLRAWFAGDARADFDQNREIQVADIFAFLRAWFAGC